jgi:hypothetical protein
MKEIPAARPRGRPVTTGKGDPVMVRILPPLMASLDDWLSQQEPQPSRPEAIRQILTDYLKRRGFLK